jgi:dienelactone hydrolase
MKTWPAAIALFALFALLALPGAVHAQAGGEASQVTLAVPGAVSTGKVSGRLTLPAAPGGSMAAVVIVNSTPGFDGRSALYASALAGAGIAALEVDFFQGQGSPASPHQNLPQLYAARTWLAAQPGVDAGRIGVMGFSWGGSVALLAASERLSRAATHGPERFAAHLALYPVCWKHHAALAGAGGAWPGMPRDAYRAFTGRPVHILVGGRDDYDGPDGCSRFVRALPPASRKTFDLTVDPDATFAWDSAFGSAPYSSAARQGRGGIVTVVADPRAAARSKAFAVDYFGRSLSAPTQR